MQTSEPLHVEPLQAQPSVPVGQLRQTLLLQLSPAPHD